MLTYRRARKSLSFCIRKHAQHGSIGKADRQKKACMLRQGSSRQARVPCHRRHRREKAQVWPLSFFLIFLGIQASFSPATVSLAAISSLYRNFLNNNCWWLRVAEACSSSIHLSSPSKNEPGRQAGTLLGDAYTESPSMV